MQTSQSSQTHMQRLLSLVKKLMSQQSVENKTIDDAKKTATADYFTLARNWADDYYATALASRNRYKLAFYSAMGCCALLVIAIMTLVPTQHIEPFLVNHYTDGRITVMPLKQTHAPINNAQVQSDIVRYVLNRESYSASSYHEQFSLINLLSDNQVAAQYMRGQSANNKHSPIHQLGRDGYRTVHIDSVLFLDSANANQQGTPQSRLLHDNLAQVDFTITDHHAGTGLTNSTPLIALISWVYRGTPQDPQAMWRNWDGFAVTRYSVEQRNVTNNNET